MNDKDILNKFGATLMASVRDRSVCKIEQAQSGALKGSSGKMLHDLFSQFNNEQQEIIKKLIVEFIDNTIFNTLSLFEEDEYKKIFIHGIDINEISDGLCGELFTEDGWISQFSKYNMMTPAR